jgi:diacylglycerol O-acyltransferase
MVPNWPRRGPAVEPMAVTDAVFLFLEETGLPMHVAGLAILDPTQRAQGPIRLEELRDRVRERLPLLPHLWRWPLMPPLGLGRLGWTVDPQIDLDRHLSFHRLAGRASGRHLLTLAAHLHAQALPRSRPLWEMALIDDLPGGRQALLAKLHHALGDGMTAVETVATLFDDPPSPTDVTRAGRLRVRPAFGRESDQGLGRFAATAAGVARYLARGPLVPPGPFNGQVGLRRGLAIADLPLDLIERTRQRLGGTVDDVALAAVVLGLDRYLRRTGVRVTRRQLRVMLPVAIPGPRDGPANRVSAIFIDLTLGRPPVESLRQVQEAKAAGRRWHEAPALATALAGTELLATPIVAALARRLAQLPFAHLIVSDVPGLSELPRLLGASLVGAYPLLPLAPRLGLSIGMLTFGGSMGLGVVVDPKLVPHSGMLVREIVTGLSRLAAASHRGDG